MKATASVREDSIVERTVVIGGERQIALNFEWLLIDECIRFETGIDPTVGDNVHVTGNGLNDFLRQGTDECLAVFFVRDQMCGELVDSIGELNLKSRAEVFQTSLETRQAK